MGIKSVSVWQQGQRWWEKEKVWERGGWKWDRQQQYKILAPSSPLLLHPPLILLSSATKGKRRRSPTPTSTQSTWRRPCLSWIQCPLPLFVCLLHCHPAAISLQLVPGYNATGTEVSFHKMPTFLLTLCQKFRGRQLCFPSVLREIFDRGLCQTISTLITMWGILFLFVYFADRRPQSDLYST